MPIVKIELRIISKKIPVVGEKLFAQARVYFENGVLDTVPNNNERQLIFNDAWLDSQRAYRLIIPVSEKYGEYHEVFNLRSFISLNENIFLENFQSSTHFAAAYATAVSRTNCERTSAAAYATAVSRTNLQVQLHTRPQCSC